MNSNSQGDKHIYTKLRVKASNSNMSLSPFLKKLCGSGTTALFLPKAPDLLPSALNCFSP